MLRRLNTKISAKLAQKCSNRQPWVPISRNFARKSKGVPRMSLKKSPADKDLPTIDKYLIEDEKLLASKIALSVEDPTLFKQVFDENKDNLTGLDVQTLLYKYLITKNGK